MSQTANPRENPHKTASRKQPLSQNRRRKLMRRRGWRRLRLKLHNRPVHCLRKIENLKIRMLHIPQPLKRSNRVINMLLVTFTPRIKNNDALTVHRVSRLSLVSAAPSSNNVPFLILKNQGLIMKNPSLPQVNMPRQHHLNLQNPLTEHPCQSFQTLLHQNILNPIQTLSNPASHLVNNIPSRTQAHLISFPKLLRNIMRTQN